MTLNHVSDIQMTQAGLMGICYIFKKQLTLEWKNQKKDIDSSVHVKNINKQRNESKVSPDKEILHVKRFTFWDNIFKSKLQESELVAIYKLCRVSFLSSVDKFWPIIDLKLNWK